jgi:hypothetical protein
MHTHEGGFTNRHCVMDGCLVSRHWLAAHDCVVTFGTFELACVKHASILVNLSL